MHRFNTTSQRRVVPTCPTLETLEDRQLLCGEGLCNADEVLYGDADLDGEVAFADFLIMSENFGKVGGVDFESGRLR